MSSDERRQTDAAFAAHKREQLERGRALTPAERLRWLQETVRALKRLQGLAKPVSTD